MSKKMKIIVITFLLGVVITLSFGAGCALDSESPSDSTQGLDVVEEAWNIILRDYVDKDELNASIMTQGAIKGMLEALDDPYSSYLDAEASQFSLSHFEGKIEGIGAQVGVKDGQLMIIAPNPDSPAAKAGIKAGDIILEVDGNLTSEMSLAEAVLNIRGPKGTPVTLLVLHQGEDSSEEIEIIRAEVELSTVHFEMKGDIAYININSFSERTDKELSPVLEGMMQEGVTGIILDLRSNTGGVLQTVIDVTSRFLEEGVVVNVVDKEGNQTPMMVKPSRIIIDLPMVVLVDGFTASGGELLAGALQDHGRATVAGTRTFGKGSVNVLRQLKDGSAIYITTGRWLTPNGRLIEGDGLLPDYELELTEENAIQWAMDYLRSNY